MCLAADLCAGTRITASHRAALSICNGYTVPVGCG
jgi:hypothetical protein